MGKQGDIAVVGFSKPIKVLIDAKKSEELIFIARAEGKIAAK